MIGGRRFLAHELDGVLVAEPVRPFDGVVHVPAPVVRTHVAERGADATLRGHGVTARGEQLGDARRREPCFGKAQRGAEPGAAGADDEHVVSVVDEFVVQQSSCRGSECHFQHGKDRSRGNERVRKRGKNE